MCFIALIPVKLVSKFTFTYVTRECYFTPPATSVRGGVRVGGKVLKISQFVEGGVTFCFSF